MPGANYLDLVLFSVIFRIRRIKWYDDMETYTVTMRSGIEDIEGSFPYNDGNMLTLTDDRS